MKLKRGCEKIIRFDLWQLTVSRPANGSCSIICRWLLTCFIGTNAPFTAWRIFGATRHHSSGKRRRRVEIRALARGERRFYFCRRCGKCRFDYFGDALGDGDGFDAGGAAGDVPASDAGLASNNSTSKIKVELGARSGPTVRSPYARSGGTNS
jgi:hypothetical protein